MYMFLDTLVLGPSCFCSLSSLNRTTSFVYGNGVSDNILAANAHSQKKMTCSVQHQHVELLIKDHFINCYMIACLYQLGRVLIFCQ